MRNNLLSFNISNNNTQFINEIKYEVRNNPKKHALQIAKEVEGLFIQILLKNMRNTLLKENLLDNNQSLLYTDIYDQKLSQEMSKKGIGLSDMILNQINIKQNIK